MDGSMPQRYTSIKVEYIPPKKNLLRWYMLNKILYPTRKKGG